jgi:hypothetical protein
VVENTVEGMVVVAIAEAVKDVMVVIIIMTAETAHRSVSINYCMHFNVKMYT